MEQGENSKTFSNVSGHVEEGKTDEIIDEVNFIGPRVQKKDETERRTDDDKKDDEKDDILDIDFTTNEEIEKMKLGQKVEIIGYVDEVEACHMAGNYLLFKFILNNNNGKRLQVVAWREEAERTEAEISIYKIIYLEKAKTKIINSYTGGNHKNFEISIKDDTIIQGLGTMKKKHIRVISSYDSKVEYPLVNLDQIQGNLLPTIMRTWGFLKTTFSVKSTGTSTRNEATSYITDGNLKLEIRILNYSANDLCQGNHVEVIGFPEIKDNYLVLTVETINEMRKMSNEIKPLKWLLKGKNSITVPEYNKRQKLN
ncbi:uncharacterized protein LOC123270117 [Cotesia glomerata]|uniref:OB domain-containing protein n=1 Tax=Cotesia glomerata TaxID=32391 RepID=A0AAV7IGV9_COTGL|nr:uncharacterized protein LOC123270117 [Cotesia glomerata]KAH0552529.1 hypothetical protein KQX54_011682 [Cotesia glomerata]